MEDKFLTEEEKKEKAKKAAAVALAAVVAAGGAAAAESPIDYTKIQMPNPIVMQIDDFDSGLIATEDEEKIAKKSNRATISKILLAPFYAIGAVATSLLDIFTAAILSPIGSILLGWIAMAAIVLGSLAACLKIAFPDIPLKELLSKKNILAVLGGTAGISAVCGIIPEIYPDAGIWVLAFKAAAGLALLVPIYIFSKRKVEQIKAKLPGNTPAQVQE